MNAETDDVIQWTIRTLVRDRCSPELEELYVRLNGILDSCNNKTHLDELDALLAEVGSQNMDPTEIVLSVDEIMRLAVERGLNWIGVELDPEISLEMLTEVADVLLLFDPTDTPSIVVDLMNAAEDTEDAFCKIMSQFGTYDEDEWFPLVLKIGDHFTTNVRKVATAALEGIESDDQLIEAADPELLKRLSRLVKADKETLGAQLVQDSLGVGLSLEHLYGLHVGSLLDLPVEQQVNQLYSLAAISSESFESAATVVSECLDDLCTEVDARRQAEQWRIKTHSAYGPIFGERNA